MLPVAALGTEALDWSGPIRSRRAFDDLRDLRRLARDHDRENRTGVPNEWSGGAVSREDTNRAVFGQGPAWPSLTHPVPRRSGSGRTTCGGLPRGVVARIARAGKDAAAAKEVAVARWLENRGVDAVRVVRDVDQPVRAQGRPARFWHEAASPRARKRRGEGGAMGRREFSCR
ncbi:hypothetical protein GCM10017786_58400 [Amycolatopsis deserti]|uniref:Uncharacterized protein n=1 Tax=Amycolatopsis deserti TaxID=185696 RepID=A0ABQ3JBL7_9PSEU|nr:hypothetical protein GCM10017786_58400 [Amycolatopsis deserti]